ncbi:TonB-dependent receptor [Caulobacter sp. BP25]|uniref:TonB-dependent receptor n=1 Tax=Caulobacter sp. BP25 TaxID=2048900 RepID=UPI000C12C019|nr:TonB-dependent receptor [Caulobacter sp. BP25]PHY17195.1 TonB-dependent receptor [Caulobacter sp. BP25]
MTRHSMLFAAASGLAMLVAASAHAQTTPAPAGDAAQVEEVVVTGVRKSLRDALAVKQGSDKVVEAISAKDIGVLPDVTIAESIARLPGVNATRDRGNDSQAVVRGLGARLVLGTINGREVASSEPDRNVRWEIYPSEVVSGVEVYKSQSADLIAGGVAATININTIAPLDYRGPAFVLRAGPVYYDGGKDIPNYGQTGYRASGSWVHKINDDLAVVLGLTSQKQKNGYGSFTGWGYNDSNARPPAGASDYSSDLNRDGKLDATPWGAQMSASRIDQTRTGVSGGLQYKPTDNFELKADALYSKIKITEVQDQTVWGANNWGNWNTGTNNIGWNDGVYNAAGASYTLINNTVVAARLPFSSVQTVLAKYSEDKDLFAGGLNGKWTSDLWTVAGDLSYSKAERTNTWKAVRFESYPTWTSFDWRAGKTPTITTSQDSLSLTQTADLAGSYDGPEHLNDELKAAALDFTRDFGGDGAFKSVQFGVRASDRVKSHSSFSYAPTATGATIPASMLTAYTLSEGANVPAILTGDIDKIAAIAYGANAFDVSKATEELAERWTVQERVYEGYGKLNFAADGPAGAWVSGNIGARVVHTQTDSEGLQQNTVSAFVAATVSNDYTDVLPSANAKLDFGGGKIVRLGLAKVIARPPLDELRASRSLSNWSPWTGSAGNPNLKPFEATQFDASAEYYFRPEALVALSYYYKDVDSYIGWKQTPVVFGGQTYTVASPANGGSGHIQGVELTFQTPFFFLPGPLSKFGIYSNYAHVESNLKEFSPANNPLRMTGLAKHTATVDLWYADGPIEARLGWKYHSPMTVIYGWNGSDLQTLESEKTLDFSSSYKISENVSVRLQVNNLTNETLRMYRDNDPNRIGRYDSYGRRYLMDVTFKF